MIIQPTIPTSHSRHLIYSYLYCFLDFIFECFEGKWAGLKWLDQPPPLSYNYNFDNENDDFCDKNSNNLDENYQKTDTLSWKWSSLTLPACSAEKYVAPGLKTGLRLPCLAWGWTIEVRDSLQPCHAVVFHVTLTVSFKVDMEKQLGRPVGVTWDTISPKDLKSGDLISPGP